MGTRLLEWVQQEAASHKVDVGTKAEWRIEHCAAPQQKNAVDCGVFAMMAASCLGVGAELSYGQEEMGVLRRCIAHNITRARVD